MLGLDDHIVAFTAPTSVWTVVLVAVLLGLRHASDPDHLAAVTTLVAGGGERAVRRAGALGLSWGAGHAVTLFAFGVPILLLDAYLPERAQQSAETAVAFVIVYLAVRLLGRWRRGAFHVHGGSRHVHAPARTQLGAFAIGLVHGVGGSAGVGVLLVAAIPSRPLAVGALALLASFTAVSMTLLSTGFGLTLVARPMQHAFNGVAPALGVCSVAFGLWYAAAAWSVMPYPF
jgi:sulfite exporter TauE/SafE